MIINGYSNIILISSIILLFVETTNILFSVYGFNVYYQMDEYLNNTTFPNSSLFNSSLSDSSLVKDIIVFKKYIAYVSSYTLLVSIILGVYFTIILYYKLIVKISEPLCNQPIIIIYNYIIGLYVLTKLIDDVYSFVYMNNISLNIIIYIEHNLNYAWSYFNYRLLYNLIYLLLFFISVPIITYCKPKNYPIFSYRSINNGYESI